MRNKLLLTLLFLNSLLFPPLCFGAIDADTVWEFRHSASNNNGGGFVDRDPGTSVDYSQQDSHQLTLTDLATSGTTVTTLTSATGGFTAAMVGNVINLTAGTNCTEGWYEVTVYTDTNTVTLDRAPDDGVGAMSATTGYLGGSLAVPSDAFFEQCVPGNIVYIKVGTYTITEDIFASKDGTSTNPIVVEGYNSSRGDTPMGSDRPTTVSADYSFGFDHYWVIKNIRFTSQDSSYSVAVNASRIQNCYAENTRGSGAPNAIGGGTWIIGCEAKSTLGRACAVNGGNVVGCYLHDSVNGWYGNNNGVIMDSIIDTCSSRGVAFDDRGTGLVKNNVIYNCGTGIYGTTGYTTVVVNNIIDACTTGFSMTTEQGTNIIDYNCWDNTTDVSNVTKGANAVTGDSGMTDPANGDFTIGSGSNCIDAGMKPSTNIGLTGAYKWNIGADQDDVSAGGSGGGTTGNIVIY